MVKLKVKEIILEKGRPKVVVPITAETPADIIAACEEVKEFPCDLVEWRADYYLSVIDGLDAWLEEKNAYVDIVKILDDMDYILGGKPIIFTIRSDNQGGRLQVTRAQLESIYSIVAEAKLADFVDIELYDKHGILHEDWLEEQLAEIHRFGGKVILSHHDFEMMPPAEAIQETIEIMHELGADVCKFAAMALSEEDVQCLLQAAEHLEQREIGPLVMIAMGEHGTKTRVTGGEYGSVMTFAAFGEASAPGQVDIHTMKKLLDEHYGA